MGGAAGCVWVGEDDTVFTEDSGTGRATTTNNCVSITSTGRCCGCSRQHVFTSARAAACQLSAARRVQLLDCAGVWLNVVCAA